MVVALAFAVPQSVLAAAVEVAVAAVSFAVRLGFLVAVLSVVSGEGLLCEVFARLLWPSVAKAKRPLKPPDLLILEHFLKCPILGFGAK